MAAPARWRPRLAVPLVDRYLLRLALKPLALGVGVLLVALLLGRVLKLVNILASNGSTEFGLLATLTASLIPHYLGLALSAAFVVAVFVAMIRLGDGSELDALLSSGLSLQRIAVPFVALGGVLCVLSFLLYGWLNPLSRYDYRSVLHAATAVSYRTDIQPGSFVEAGRGAVISADGVDADNRRLEGVFIHQRENGGERITTATSGEVVLGEDGVHLKLILQNGVSVLQNEGGAPVRSQFRRLNFQTSIVYAGRPFRARGQSEREMTLPELWREYRSPATEVGPAAIKAEIVDRVLRPLALLFMPLLAIPLSLASKRGSRATGLAASAVLLVTFNNALQFGKDLAAGGHGPAFLTASAPFLLFAALTTWLFVASALHPTEAPVGRVLARFAGAGAAAGHLLARTFRRRRPA